MTDRSEMWKGLHIGTTMSSFVICGALLIWTGLLEMDLASGALGMDATAGALASLSLSIVLAALSFGSVRTDHITSGLTMLYIALSSATRSVSSIALGTWDMPVIELTYSIPLVAFVVVSFSRGRYMATAASVMLLTSNVLSSTLRDETSMWFSDLLRDGKLTEALMNMYIGLSVLAFSLVTLFFDTGGALPMEIVFAVGIAMTAAIFIFRRNWALATTAGGMALVYLIPPLTGTAETVPLGVIALVAGAALMVYSMLGAILGEKGERILERDRARFAVDSGKDYSILLVATSGMFTASMVGLDSSLFDMSIAFCVPGLFLSAVTCVAALYSMFHGRPGTCMYLLSMALVSATWDTAVILGAEADPMVISIGTFLLLTSVFPLVLRGFRVLAATAALSSVAIVLGILTGTEAVWTAGLMIYSVMTLAYAVNRWIGGEIGRAPLPTMV